MQGASGCIKKQSKCHKAGDGVGGVGGGKIVSISVASSAKMS